MFIHYPVDQSSPPESRLLSFSVSLETILTCPQQHPPPQESPRIFFIRAANPVVFVSCFSSDIGGFTFPEISTMFEILWGGVDDKDYGFK
jgi:hypothetical protein